MRGLTGNSQRRYFLTMPPAAHPAHEAEADLGLLPLENGDRLGSEEFIRRYEAMPEVKKAELIEGVVYVASPVSRKHAKPDSLVQGFLLTYESRTPGVESLTNATVILDDDNAVQPDALLRLLPERGGKTSLNEKDLIVGPPELIVEVAASSAAIDLHDKLRAYRRNRVPEYLVWLVAERKFTWLALKSGQYVEQRPNSEGLIASQTFPGLVLAVNALLALNPREVLIALQKGIDSPAHANFLARA